MAVKKKRQYKILDDDDFFFEEGEFDLESIDLKDEVHIAS